MNNLHTIKNPETFPAILLNACGLVTSAFDPVLNLNTAAPAPTSSTTSNA